MSPTILTETAPRMRRPAIRMACVSLLALAVHLAAPAPAEAQAPAAGAQRPAAADCPPVAAGQPLAIGPGMCRLSSIGAEDPKTEHDVPFEDWSMTLRAGDVVQVDMDALEPAQDGDGSAEAAAATPVSAEATTQTLPPDHSAEDHYMFAFDTLLEVRREGEEDAFASNDDRSDSLNSTLVFTAPAEGVYLVRARPLWGAEGGAYTLRVSQATAAREPAPLEPGTVHADIAADGPASEYLTGLRSALYGFTAAAGEPVRLSASSSAGQVVMNLVGPNGDPVAQAEATGAEAVILTVLQEAGPHRLEVATRPTTEPARITLQMQRRSPAAERSRAQRIRADQEIAGELGINSTVGSSPYGGLALREVYALRVKEGETLTLTLDADAFDPVLEVGAITPLGFAQASADDDGGPGMNSWLVIRPEQSGTLLLRVRSYGSRSGGGPFVLRARRGEHPPGDEAPVQAAAAQAAPTN